jgi:hypothetical protein
VAGPINRLAGFRALLCFSGSTTLDVGEEGVMNVQPDITVEQIPRIVVVAYDVS